MRNKLLFVYILIVILLIFMFSFSFFIQTKEEESVSATETQKVQQTIEMGKKQLRIQLTAIAEGTPTP